MAFDFRERSADLVSSHTEALDNDFKRVRVGCNLYVVFFSTYKKAHCVQGKLKFRRSANEAGPNRLFNAFPGKLDCQELVVVIGLCFVAATGFDISSIIKVASLFLQV